MITAADAEQHRADASVPASVRIELVHRLLPDLDSDDLAGRLEAAARLDPLDGVGPRTGRAATSAAYAAQSPPLAFCHCTATERWMPRMRDRIAAGT